MNINLYAPLIISKEFNKQLPKKSLGHIINILDQNVVNPDTSFFCTPFQNLLYYLQLQSWQNHLLLTLGYAIGPGPTLKIFINQKNILINR